MRKIGMLSSAILLLLATSAGSEQNEDARKCTALTDGLQRLTCFDRVFPDAGDVADIAETPKEDTGFGYWSVSRSRNAIDDSPVIVGTLLAEETTGSTSANSGLGLMVRCRENTTSVMLHTDMFMTTNPRVTIRIGSGKATTTTWERSESYKAAGLWTGAQAIPFLRSLANGDRLVVRVEERSRQEAVFNVGNVEAIRSEVAEACNWPS